MKRFVYSLRMFFVAWRVYGDLHKLARKTEAGRKLPKGEGDA